MNIGLELLKDKSAVNTIWKKGIESSLSVYRKVF